MPAYNEERTVAAVIQRVLREVPCAFELIVVDDGSTDRTREIIEELAAKDSRIRTAHKENGGKASALKQGFEMSRGEIVIIQDADLEYDPSEIVHVIQPIVESLRKASEPERVPNKDILEPEMSSSIPTAHSLDTGDTRGT